MIGDKYYYYFNSEIITYTITKWDESTDEYEVSSGEGENTFLHSTDANFIKRVYETKFDAILATMRRF